MSSRDRARGLESIGRVQVRALKPGHVLIGGLGAVVSTRYLPATNDYDVELGAAGETRTVRLPANSEVSIWKERQR